MLRIDRGKRTFARIPSHTLSENGILERTDLQAMIASAPREFFEELGERVTVLAQEVRPDDVVDDRIDLLAADENGSAVIIELKRGNHRMHLLQALSYAGMLSKLASTEFIERVAKYSGKSRAQIEELLEDIIEGGATAINQAQRIILIAEAFDYSVLITAEWLSEQYHVDIRCYRLRLAGDQDAEFLTCERVYPPAELTEQAVRARIPGSTAEPRFKDWSEALAGISNKDIVDFFEAEIADGRRGYSARRILNWTQDGQRRFWVAARRNYAYGWQIGRFDGDLEFWRKTLKSVDDDIAVVGRYDHRVRFRLRTAEQIKAFRQAVTVTLAQQVFTNSTPEAGEPEDEM